MIVFREGFVPQCGEGSGESGAAFRVAARGWLRCWLQSLPVGRSARLAADASIRIHLSPRKGRFFLIPSRGVPSSRFQPSESRTSKKAIFVESRPFLSVAQTYRHFCIDVCCCSLLCPEAGRDGIPSSPKEAPERKSSKDLAASKEKALNTLQTIFPHAFSNQWH